MLQVFYRSWLSITEYPNLKFNSRVKEIPFVSYVDYFRPRQWPRNKFADKQYGHVQRLVHHDKYGSSVSQSLRSPNAYKQQNKPS